MQAGLKRRLGGLPDWARWSATPYPPGHYHSPLPDLHVAPIAGEVEDPPATLPGIDLRVDAQRALAQEFFGYYPDMPFEEEPKDGLRYHLDCTWFAHGDATALHCMLRHLKPARYVELGSGWSSACALDTAELFLDNAVEFTFIDPNPERLRSVLRPSDNVRIIDTGAEVDWSMVSQLEAGDVLFIDSSHVSKYGSEVNRLFLDIFPRLPAGVNIHVHDIFWPFSYPVRWLNKGRAWNEAYLLRAWLCDNPRAEITWFNSYLSYAARAEIGPKMPAWDIDPGTSIWIQTVQERRPA
ncbi:MAG: class I SAM-dependent methyltransferase [Jatrophihabitans sp.]